MTKYALTYAAVVELLNQAAIKHESHSFASGAVMLDIWFNDRFYVMQFEEGIVGISEVTEDNPGFSTTPDEILDDHSAVLAKVNSLIA